MKNDVNRTILRTFGTFIGQISQNLSTRLIQYFESFGTFRTVLVCIFKNPTFLYDPKSPIANIKFLHLLVLLISIFSEKSELSLTHLSRPLTHFGYFPCRSTQNFEYFSKTPHIRFYTFIPTRSPIFGIIRTLLGAIGKIHPLLNTKNRSSSLYRSLNPTDGLIFVPFQSKIGIVSNLFVPKPISAEKFTILNVDVSSGP